VVLPELNRQLALEGAPGTYAGRLMKLEAPEFLT
jgi:hypothetical protein